MKVITIGIPNNHLGMAEGDHPKTAMMMAKEPEAPAQETTETGEKEAQIDTNPEGNTMKTTAETMELAQATETTVLTERTMNMKEDTEMIQDLGTLGRTHQVKVGDTLVTLDDGDAKGLLVMKGPLQANP